MTTKRKIYYSLFAIVGLVWLTLGACSLTVPKHVPVPTKVEVVQPKPVVKAIKKPVPKQVQPKTRPKPVAVAPVAKQPEFRWPWE